MSPNLPEQAVPKFYDAGRRCPVSGGEKYDEEEPDRKQTAAVVLVPVTARDADCSGCRRSNDADDETDDYGIRSDKSLHRRCTKKFMARKVRRTVKARFNKPVTWRSLM